MARKFSLMCASALTMAAATGAQAQVSAPNATADAGSGGLEDIVVIAQKRSENLQNVPIAVSAVTGADLQTRRVTDVLDLRLAVPSLNITNSNGNVSTNLRGLGSTAVNAGYENTTAFYVDGVYLASQQATFLGLSNAAQVEVLKGPQGTLFGRNATAGLIQITTRTPGDAPTVEGRLSYGNYGTIEGAFYAATPIATGVAADISFYGTHMADGWGRNRTRNVHSYVVDHNIMVRSKWVFDPAEGTKVTLIGDYSDSSDTATSKAALRGTVNPFYRSKGPAPDLGYDTVNNSPDVRSGWSAGGSLKIEQEIASLTLMSLTAYRKSRYAIGFDYDQGPSNLAEVTFVQPDRQFSQELQLQSGTGGPLTWTVGAYYFNARSAYDPFHLNLYAAGSLITISNHQKTESIAGFAQATYEVAPDTNLTLGGRYTWEKRTAYDGTTSVFLIGPGTTLPTVVAPDRKADFNKFTFRVSIDHRFSQQLLGYASFNRGFKSGGFNTGTPNSAPYLPESIDAYEIGFKSDLADHHLRINAAAYYYDYTNIQAQRLASGVIQIVNAASAKIYGVDVDFEALLTRGFTLSGGFNLGSSKFKSYPGALIGNINGLPSVVGDADGNYLPNASKLTFNLAANYAVDFRGGKINLNANLYYNDGYYLEADNKTRQHRYAQLGAAISWTSPDDHFTVGLFGKNLTDRRVLNYSSTVASNGMHVGLYGPPRTYGVNAGFKF
jgi:iron complex outermembrane receptor protein